MGDVHASPRSLRLSLLATTALALTAVSFPVQAQQISTTGDVNPVYPGGNPWNVGGDLRVGDAADGTLTIQNGGAVTSPSFVYVGFQANGLITLDNGTLTSERLFVGNQAGSQGNVLITNGSVVTTTGAVPAAGAIALSAGSTGTITLSNNSVWNSVGSIGVGQIDGTGHLNVLSGSQVNITSAVGSGLFIGNVGSTATGFVLIDGAGSAVNSVANVYVGASAGTGTVTVQNGGLLHADGLINAGGIGGGNSTGTITVTGLGSAMTAGQDINIGMSGGGTFSLLDQATATAVGVFRVGTMATGVGTALVDGAGTSATAASLIVGDAGVGTLTLANQGVFNAAGGATIAAQAGSTGTLNIGAAAGAAPAAPGVLNSPTVTFGAGTGRLVFNHSDTSGTYDFAPVISGAGAVDVYNGVTRMTSASTYSGPTTVFGGTLAAGAANVLSPTSNFTVEAPGTLDLLGFNQTLASLTNAGTVEVGAPGGTPGTVLTTGNYVGQGGTVGLNTFLGGDGSPSDLLVIDGGSATGTSGLRITNVGGGGALTTGDGIRVVDATNGGTTDAGAFTLSGRAAAGAYEYTLFRGGASDAQDWFLRSIYTGPIASPSSPAATPGAPVLPNYRVEVPVDMAVPALANRFGLTMLGTYHDRNGEDYADGPVGSDEQRAAAWGRLFGETGSVKNSASDAAGRLGKFEKHGPNYDFDVAGLQAGRDLYRRQSADGTRDIAGLSIGAGRIIGDIDAVYGGKAGSVSMNGYSLGAYWTRKGATGWYVDAVVQGTWYDDVEANSIYGEKLKTDGWGLAASLEGGYPIALGGGWSVEPQAQLIYQRVSLDNGADSFGRINYDDTDAVYGRVGGRVVKNWSIADGRVVTTWARANIWHSFGADATTTFTNLQGEFPVALKTDLGGTWTQLGFGASGQVAENVNLFVSGDYNLALAGGDGHSLSGRLGVRVIW